MKNILKIICLAIILIVIALGPFSQAAVMAQPDEEAAGGQTLRVLLPEGMEGFGQAFGELAATQGLDLTLTYVAGGANYLALLEKYMQGENPPDIFYLEDSLGARSLMLEGAAAELNDPDTVGMLAAALARHIPQAAQIQGLAANYGFPLGYYAEGYIANVGLLAALLGTEDVAGLTKDLFACSFEEFEALASTAQAYLAQPGKSTIQLSGNSYILPRYRSNDAKSLRAVFSFAADEGQAYTNGWLGKMLSNSFDSPEELLQMDGTKKRLALEQGLPGFFSAVELETRYMERDGGQAARGAGFWNGNGEMGSRQALNAFLDGRTLFYRGNTKDMANMLATQPELAGSLALIPLKMGEQAREGAPVDGILAFWPEGYLCIRAASANKTMAGQALARLFAFADGQQLIRETLQIVPFGLLHTTENSERTVLNAIRTGQASRVPAERLALQETGELLGRYIMENMMEEELWDDEAFLRFSDATLLAFGADGYYTGDQEDATDQGYQPQL